MTTEEVIQELYTIKRKIGLAKTNYYDRGTDVKRMTEWQTDIDNVVKKLSIAPVSLDEQSEATVCDNPNCVDGVADRDFYGHPIYCEICEQTGN